MAQHLRVLAALLEDLGSSSSTHMTHLPVTPVPGDLTPQHKTCRQNTSTHEINIDKTKKQKKKNILDNRDSSVGKMPSKQGWHPSLSDPPIN